MPTETTNANENFLQAAENLQTITVQWNEIADTTFTFGNFTNSIRRTLSRSTRKPNMTSQLTEAQKKDVDKVIGVMEYCALDESSLVYLVAQSKNYENNTIQRIPKSGGKIVGSFVYDQVKDEYQLSAQSLFRIGIVPVSYVMQMKDNPSWYTHVPLPEEVVLENIPSKIKYEIDNFKESNKGCSFYYVHVTGYF